MKKSCKLNKTATIEKDVEGVRRGGFQNRRTKIEVLLKKYRI